VCSVSVEENALRHMEDGIKIDCSISSIVVQRSDIVP